MQRKTTQRKLVLNTAPIIIPDAIIQVGRQPFINIDELRSLRERYRNTHIFKRRSDFIIDIPVSDGAHPLGEAEDLRLKDDFSICKALILDAYLRYLINLGREIIDYSPLEFLADEDLLRASIPDGLKYPDWLSVRLRYQIDIRRHQTDSIGILPILTLGLNTAVVIDGTCADLMEYGIDLVGKYVLKILDENDPRLRSRRRLLGKVLEIKGQTLFLGDTLDDENSINANQAFLEPRRENLQVCLQIVFRDKSDTIWQRLYSKICDVNDGEAKLKRIREALSFFARQNMEITPGIPFQVGDQQVEQAGHFSFPPVSQERSPIYVFGPSQKTDTWHNRGLENFGPYDQSIFTPSSPNIAVICQARFRGQTEHFLHKLLDGIHGVTDRNGREPFGKGIVRLYCLDRCYLEFFEVQNESPDAYRAAIGRAVDSAADRKFQWNLAIVQIQENFHGLSGDANPYLVSKAAFLLHGIPSQEVEIETMELPDNQLVYVLNNLALAFYAKLGGIPWLIQANRGIAHELVFGLGSASIGEGRLGSRERVVGITTVFTGDGNYILENRSKAVTMDEYPTVLLESLKATVAHGRQTFNWQKNDPVRLVFHAFKPFRNVQIEAVKTMISEMTDYHIQYAFLHLIKKHPYLLFDETNTYGVWDAQAKGKKGRYAPQRGLTIHLSNLENLLILTGAREVKRLEDGLPSPILLRLDRNSTFQDMRYLTRQVYHFANHSWRSFFPSSMPITILYSELIASSRQPVSDVQMGFTSYARTYWPHEVVSMSDTKRLLAGDVRVQCLERVAGLRGTKTVNEAFAAWLLGREYLDLLDLRSAAMESAVKSGAERSYRDVAILGYAVALSPELDVLKQPLIDGLKWLCGRKPFHHSVVSYEVDGAALLGFVLGADAVNLTNVQLWIASFINRSALSRITSLDRACIAATTAIISQSHLATMSMDEEFADFRVAFQSRGLNLVVTNANEMSALKHILQCDPSDIEKVHCAVHVRVLDWIVNEVCNINLTNPTVEDVIGILERVPAALKRWRWDANPVRGRPPIHWQIDDEYHVQDLLWVILAPIFPDLEDEENLPSLGHKHPRCDLGIPSLHVIIEVKFIRQAADFAKVTEGIAADHTLYLQAASSYNKIIAFIWDNSASIDQHAELKQALSKMCGIAGAVIVSRPNRMKRG